MDKVLQFSGYGTLVLYGGYFVVQFYFILGLNFISLCFKLIIIHYHILKQREINFLTRIKLHHSRYTIKIEVQNHSYNL